MLSTYSLHSQDVSGFTPLTEEMCKRGNEGAEKVINDQIPETEFLNNTLHRSEMYYLNIFRNCWLTWTCMEAM